MMVLQKLMAKLRTKAAAKSRPTSRPRLEELEDRLTPAPVAGTYTNAVVQINPVLASFSVRETVIATVTNAPTYNPITNTVTPIPPGAVPPTSGTVLFKLNNLQESAQLNSKGQATVTFTLPLFAVLTSQNLAVDYQGNITGTGGTNDPSSFDAPLYMNYLNLLFSATLTFGQLTPQQVTGTFTQNPDGTFTTTALPLSNTAQGETDQVGPFGFIYADPGNISDVDVFGFKLPGIFAFPLGAYGPQFTASSSSSSSSH